MRMVVTDRAAADVAGDVVLSLFHAKAQGLGLPFAKHLRKDAVRLVARGTDAMTWFETRRMKAPRVLLFSLSEEKLKEGMGGAGGSLHAAEIESRGSHDLRVAGALLERACDSQGIKHVVIAGLPRDCDPAKVLEGLLLRAHGSKRWREGEATTSVVKVTICVSSGQRKLEKKRLERTFTITQATNWARELGDLPGNIGTPGGIVKAVERRLGASGLKISKISRARAKALQMGLFCAVDQGSSNPGTIMMLEHRPRDVPKDAPLLVLLGKGLTHDTGGYNIKTSMTLHELTHDKCGATAVFGAMEAIAALGVRARVLAVCPLAENCIDAKAYKPGDILRAHGGTTVYIENTDAEGRLVLADMLAWVGARAPAPAAVIDIATLTGSAHVALGDPYSALFCNDDALGALVMEAGRRSDDGVWPLPIHDLHDRELGHHKAQIKNMGVAGGAACSAAAFLRNFVCYPWAHVDIAGKAHSEFPQEYYGPGATGVGCRLLVHAAELFAAAHSDDL